jgi:hypothetical protein
LYVTGVKVAGGVPVRTRDRELDVTAGTGLYMGVFDWLGGLFGSDTESDAAGKNRGERSRTQTAGDDSAAVDVPEPAGAVSDLRASMFEEARELVESWPEVDLDFTPESLSRLDAFVDEQWSDKERFRGAEIDFDDPEDMTDAIYTGLVLQLGGYYGEVLVRNYDAEWTQERGGVGVTIHGDDEATANIFHIAGDCLTEPSKFALNHDHLVEVLDLDGPEVSEGGQMYTTGGLDIYENTEQTPEEWVAALHDEGEQFADEYEAYETDFTPASLARVDAITERMAEDFDLTDAELGKESGGSLALTTHALELGGYLAGVLREQLDAEWDTDREPPVLRVAGPDDEQTLNPVAHAAQCMHGNTTFVGLYERLRTELGLDVSPIDEAEALAVLGSDDIPLGGVETTDTLAARASGFASTLDADLDFSPESLRTLDGLIGDTVSLDDRETLGDVLAYFGETLCQTYDCEWASEDDVGWILVLPADDEVMVMPVVTLVEQLQDETTLAAAHDQLAGAMGIEEPRLAESA